MRPPFEFAWTVDGICLRCLAEYSEDDWAGSWFVERAGDPTGSLTLDRRDIIEAFGHAAMNEMDLEAARAAEESASARREEGA